MIGVRKKVHVLSDTNDTSPSEIVPSFNLQVGQGAIYGYVTRRNSLDNTVLPVVEVMVTLFGDNTLVAFTRTGESGIFIFDAINAPGDYTLEFRKETTVVTSEFRLNSEEVKQINMELT